jgi:hypothetical protein
VTAHASQFRVLDERDRIRGARVLRERRVVEVERARMRIGDNVLQNHAEPASGREDLRLRVGGELDHLRIATTLEVDHAGVAPPVLVIAD